MVQLASSARYGWVAGGTELDLEAFFSAELEHATDGSQGTEARFRTELPVSVIHGLTNTRSGLQIQLTLSGGKWVANPSGTSGGNRVKFDQKLKTLEPERDGSYTTLLNDALQGASNYPILNAILGTAVGVGTGGAALLFTVATTTLSLTHTSLRVLAREGDEIWRVEEIGKVSSGTGYRPTYVLAYFLVDPFRDRGSTPKGWLIHEDRYELAI